MDINQRFLFFKSIKQPRETYDGFMGYFTTYYLNIYDQHEEKKWFLSWNWSSFSLAFLQMEVLWLLYRRMYLFAFLIGIFMHTFYTMLSYKIAVFFASVGGVASGKILFWILRLLFTFGFTVFSNALYFYFIRQKIEKGIQLKGPNPFATIIFIMVYLYLVFFMLPDLITKNPQAMSLYKNFLNLS